MISTRLPPDTRFASIPDMTRGMSHSRLDKLNRCPRQYSHYYGDRLAENSSVPAEFSTWLIHAPLAHYWQEGTDPDWKALNDGFLGNSLGASKPYYSLDVGKKVFEEYTKRDDIPKREDVLLVEKALARPIVGPENFSRQDMPYISKPDLIYTAGDTVITEDYKGSYKYRERAEFDEQIVGQGWITGSNLHIRTAITFNITSGGTPKVEIDRVPLMLSDNLIREFQADVKDAMNRRVMYERAKYFPKRTDSCFAFGKTCDFYEICAGRKQVSQYPLRVYRGK